VPISSTGEYDKAVKVYQQLDKMDSVFSWAGLGLALAMNESGDQSVKGVCVVCTYECMQAYVCVCTYVCMSVCTLMLFLLLAYDKAIQLCDSDNVLKASLLTAVAMVHYISGRKNDCKTFLFIAYANIVHY